MLNRRSLKLKVKIFRKRNTYAITILINSWPVRGYNLLVSLVSVNEIDMQFVIFQVLLYTLKINIS